MAENPSAHPTLRAEKDFGKLDSKQSSGRDIDELMPFLLASTTPLRSANEGALAEALRWLDETNHRRWKKGGATNTPSLADREHHILSVRSALSEFRQTRHFEMLAPFKDAFDPQTGELLHAHAQSKDYQLAIRGLFRCFLLSTNLIAFTLVLLEFLEVLLEIEKRNGENRMQWPTAFAKMLVRSANEKTGGGNPLDMGVGDQDHDRVDHASSGSSVTLVNGDMGGKGEKEASKDKDKTSKHKSYGLFLCQSTRLDTSWIECRVGNRSTDTLQARTQMLATLPTDSSESGDTSRTSGKA
jgi:hypothetical protein